MTTSLPQRRGESGESDALIHPPVRAKYSAEDTRPTSKKELAGWYSYGWAAEVFAVCAMGSFLPITLEQMTRDQGVLLSDKKTPCTASWPTTPAPGLGTASNVTSNITASPPTGAPQCVIYVLGMEINTASFAMYTFSLSVLVQSIIIISMSAAADHGVYRKTFLLTFAVVGALSMILFLFLLPRLYLLAAVLAIVANTGFGASFVLLNSFLPVLVRNDPSIQAARITAAEEERAHRSARIEDGNAILEEVEPVNSALVSAELQLSTKISSNGIGIGYIASVLVQVTCILLVVATNSTTFSLRLVLFVIGVWWLVFSLPAALWLRPRPGPPLPESAYGKGRWAWVSYIAFAWLSLGRTMLHARQLKDVLLFLAAWFLLSDGIATVSGTAVLFAKTQLGMEIAALGLINVTAMASGVIGAFSWSYVSHHFKLRPSRTIVACICLFEIIPLYGLLGFLPAIQRLGVFGLQQPWEMYVLGAVYGIVIGGLSSYCRSFFGELIPPGFEASFYALYAITDKGSSMFGPAIVGAITDRYGEIRPAFGFLAILILLPLPLMLLVDVDRGKRDAKELADALEGVNHATTNGGEYIPVATQESNGTPEENRV
ncbi:Autophagy protein 22 [Ophidiomyces ophidiicola]|nr:Autophagy protein 22 [Ophidiomyces ophidiicola]KAI1916219.1 Autophagy protein 22 [Ophidiomyces ophidiicola]KAI1929422.1 Autophagy protein 22 [Ophidiomyces ophidiicola]KAI1944513.1 Autophagy protein 22 [Ophidiomyces ophidiicola]KAI2054726.1 Autophagy protein 22 [Ophidiomyces ophidiicola]KAI2142070.1 Autophagy protein 22 [Ophidiomyces ophidiicola]